MYRKFLIPAIAVAVVIIGVAAWLLLRRPDVCKAIPASSVAVIKVSSWPELADKLNTTYTGMEAAKTEAVQRLQSELNTMAGLLSGDKSLLKSVNSDGTLASLHLTSADNYDYLFVSAMPGISDNSLLNRIQGLPSVKSVNVRIFKGNKLLEARLKSGKAVTFACRSGILMFSFTSFLTEAAVSALSSGRSIASDDAFSDAYKAAKRATGLRVMVNFPQLEIMLPAIVVPGYTARISGWKQAGDWGAFTLDLTNEELKLTGAVFSNTKSTAVKDAGNTLANALTYIPANAAVADISINDTALYADDGLTASFFRSWSGDFRAFITLESIAGNDAGQNLFIIQVKDAYAAHLSLMNMLNAEGSSATAVDTFMSRPIYQMKSGALLNHFFGNTFTEMKEAYFTVNGGLAVFANNPDVMRLTLENISTRNTLSGTDLVKQVKTGDTRFVYFNPQRASALLTSFTPTNSTTGSFLNQFSKITLRVKEQKKLKEVEVVFVADGSAPVAQGLLWKLQLKTAIVNAPAVVRNKATGKNELLAQDTAGNIYLVNAGGEIVFTRAIGEKVFDAVEQVDYYHNGSYQYLFHTPGKVYLVDERGLDVAGYPLRLGSPATAPMSVWIDEIKKITRYFIPCANGSIYGYEVTGKPVAGWSPRSGIGAITTSATILEQQGKVMVVAYTTDGRLWLFDARGNKLWAAENMGGTNAPVILKQQQGFVFLAAQGNQLIELDVSGNDHTVALVDSANAFTAFTKDSGYVYVYATGDALRSYDATGKFLSSAGLKGSQISKLYTLPAGEGILIVAEDTIHSKLYLLNSELKIVREITVAEYVSYKALPLFSPQEIVLLVATRQGRLACIR